MFTACLTPPFRKTESEMMVALPSLACFSSTERFVLVVSPQRLYNPEDLHVRTGADDNF